jgi:hypothetical protein
MNAQITKTRFTCELVTIHSKRSFADLISRIESTFQQYDAKTLRDFIAEGDTEKLAAYVKKVGEPTEFAIFFWLDQGSTSGWLVSRSSHVSTYSVMRRSLRVSSGTRKGRGLERRYASVSHRGTVRRRTSTLIFQSPFSASSPKRRTPPFRGSWMSA